MGRISMATRDELVLHWRHDMRRAAGRSVDRSWTNSPPRVACIGARDAAALRGTIRPAIGACRADADITMGSRSAHRDLGGDGSDLRQAATAVGADPGRGHAAAWSSATAPEIRRVYWR